jgi:hypothetical protein
LLEGLEFWRCCKRALLRRGAFVGNAILCLGLELKGLVNKVAKTIDKREVFDTAKRVEMFNRIKRLKCPAPPRSLLCSTWDRRSKEHFIR